MKLSIAEDKTGPCTPGERQAIVDRGIAYAKMKDDDAIREALMKRFEKQIDPKDIEVLRGRIKKKLSDNHSWVKVAIPLISQGDVGQGSSGEVEKFKEPFSGRLLTIKEAKGKGYKGVRKRFYGLFLHPNLSIHHGAGRMYGKLDGTPVECADFAMGKTLYEILEEKARNPEFGAVERLQIILDVIDATQALHAKGFAHRDVAPKNIIIGPLGDDLQRAVLVDHRFVIDLDGFREEIGHLIHIRGTPPYIPPYSLKNHTDLSNSNLKGILEGHDGFSIGRLLVEVFGGRLALFSQDEEEIHLSDKIGQEYLEAFAAAIEGEAHFEAKFEEGFPFKENEKEGGFNQNNLVEVAKGLLCFDLDQKMPLTEAREKVVKMLESLRGKKSE